MEAEIVRMALSMLLFGIEVGLFIAWLITVYGDGR